jgi:hypothetical protein
MKKLPRSSVLCLLLAAPFAHADWGDFDFKFEADKPWVEVAAQLPPYPRGQNLIPFAVSPVTRNQYLIDAPSVSVGADGVVRYTVVIEAAGGAHNVSYEGIRCATGERRFYAYGHSDQTWSKADDSHWTEIDFRSPLSYQKVLSESFFCPDGIAVRDAASAIARLKRGLR